MRSFDDIEHRWSTLWGTSIGVDLREAIRDAESTFDPCEEGLRSICWRAFLLYGPLSKGSWTKKLAESRSAYASLRDHFLKYINNPNDLHSSTDPLADDESSPWSSLRQDESSREEIFQDVTRCMQDNYFFREPTTQKKLLDILFIYSKLNPDTGYRQGMHELLAPILWVVYQDAIDLSRVPQSAKDLEGADLMLEILNKKYIEHDAFSLFCAVMQTAKGFYELGENRDSSAIVAQSDRIHNELLMAVDPELSRHLTIVGVLPQIYSIRWIRLLFGREFDFKDVLKMWDLLFAENLTLDIIDMTCVAMLLRVRWQLVDADYTTAITNLSHFQLPATQPGPRSLVRDATFLLRKKGIDGGATIIQLHSGKRPKTAGIAEERPHSPAPSQIRQPLKRWSQVDASPGRSPARSGTPQKQLESIFQEVSGNLQRQVEGWSVSKVVRGAVGEVRRNVNNLQATHLRGPSFDASSTPTENLNPALERRIQTLEMRNRALAKMLDGALNSLRVSKPGRNSDLAETDNAFNVSLAKIQFVSVYLADSDIPLPSSQGDDGDAHEGDHAATADSAEKHAASSAIKSTAPEEIRPPDKDRTTDSIDDALSSKPLDTASTLTQQVHEPSKPSNLRNTRPTLADASFSFMLGENRHRSSFVTSVSTLPEQRRNSNSQHAPQATAIESKDKNDKKDWKDRKDRKERPERKEQRTEDDGFTLSSFE